jgi:outer membrane PBP1 activator LpoA protein
MHLFRRSLPTLLMALLAACASPGGTTNHFPAAPPAPAPVSLPPSLSPTGDAALAAGDYSAAVGQYLRAANAVSITTEQAAELRLRAADAAGRAGDPVQADGILDQIPATPLNARLQVRYRLLRAQMALARNDPARALRLLPQGDPGGDPELAERQLMIRARAAFLLGDAVAATQSLVLRERYLGHGEIAANHDAIWAGLTTTPLDAGTQTRANAADPVTRGWVELALLARRNAALGDYDAWRNRFPGHPAEDRLATLFMPVGPASGSVTPPSAALPSPMNAGSSPAARSGNTALLLPHSGALAGLADAVHAGYASAAAHGGQPDGRSYDVGSLPAVEALRQALGDGAGLAVGPLRKEEVATLAAAGPPPVPVLALNYLDAGRPAPAGLYQFGLAPEDEARAAAEDAAARGLHAAIALVPNTERGARVLGAFQQRFAELGGRVIESGRYYGEQQYWSDSVRKLLRFTSVEDKKKLAEMRAAALPGIDPQRRNDFDVIFIEARAGDARQLWPLFRFYRADRIPIYATSSVNEGSGDNDLSGIRFCDAPWLLDTAGTWSALRADAGNGRTRDSARLFALGADAFSLSQRLAQGGLHPGDEIAGATGTLRVDNAGVIHRGLVCAQTTTGEPFVTGHGTP